MHPVTPGGIYELAVQLRRIAGRIGKVISSENMDAVAETAHHQAYILVPNSEIPEIPSQLGIEITQSFSSGAVVSDAADHARAADVGIVGFRTARREKRHDIPWGFAYEVLVIKMIYECETLRDNRDELLEREIVFYVAV